MYICTIQSYNLTKKIINFSSIILYISFNRKYIIKNIDAKKKFSNLFSIVSILKMN